MSTKSKYLIASLLGLGLLILAVIFLRQVNIPVLNPSGAIAVDERNLMVMAVALMSIIVIPVFIITFIIAVKYREGNKKAKYVPDLKHSRFFELSWWAIPTLIILILAVFNWKSTHALDPFVPLNSSVRPLVIQVVALPWKWLFIYPEQNIATVNFIEFSEKTPINFELTADAPMSSFWIPALSGQMYAMTGMGTKLHLIANKTGDYAGSATEINGKGFAGMKFVARAVSKSEFETWVKKVKQSSNNLNFEQYKKLAVPSENDPVVSYSSTEDNLYNKIMMKYMVPEGTKLIPEMKGVMK